MKSIRLDIAEQESTIFPKVYPTNNLETSPQY